MFKILFSVVGVFFSSLTLAETCTYEFDLSKSVVEGTGFKFTEKVGVTAKFTGVKLGRPEKKSSMQELIQGQTVIVDLMTIDSGNALRDQNLRESLFANILGDSIAQFTVKNVTDKKIETELLLNEKTKAVLFDYTIAGETLTAKGKFDAVDFAMNESIAALKKRCGSLHAGADDKSVTWTEFDLSLKAKATKKCK